MSARRRDEDGVAAMVVAVSAMVFCGLLALVVDLGIARDRQQVAQNAADAAALGAAVSLAHATNPAAVTASDISKARAVADQYVTANGWPSGLATFTIDAASATVGVALTPEQSPQIFAAAIGANTPTVGASAQATWRNAPAPCALCVLGDLSAQNGQTVNSAGNILIRGGLNVAPNGVVASTTGIVGVGGTITNNGTVTPPPVPITPITDPYAVTPPLPPGPPAPPLGSPAVAASGGQCRPGTYTDVTPCRAFAPGVYVITDRNRFTGNITVTANGGVLFYLTCSSGSGAATVSAACPQRTQGGSLEFAGTVSASITALPDPAYRGLAIIYDRNNTAPLGLVGGPNVTINGGVYAAAATLTNNGTGPLTVDGSMVVGGIDLRGVPATVTITQANAFADLPPMLIHLTR